MAETLEKLIGMLNKDLELEYSAAIQYINHAAVMTGAA
jgi:bacterioferritin (cytochrome b1)